MNKSYYEKRGSEVRCIDDEIPFEIPENWEWCRLGSIVMTSGGKTPSTSNKSYWENGDILWVTSKDMKSTYISDSIKKLTPIGASDLKLLKSNTILIVVRSGILRRTLPVSILVAEATINQDLKSLTSYIDEGVPLYLYWSIIGNEEYILEKYAKDGTTVESLNFDKFLDFLIPIPPLSEQQCIVESIEQAFVLIDNIESDKSDLHKAIKQTKGKVLDLAIRGKLVPQDPNDEPASVLLERIKAEKQASAKGTKKQQKQPATTSDNSHYENMPFEIPDSWMWTTLGDVGTWQSGSTPSRLRKDYYDGCIPWLKTGDLNDGVIDTIPESISDLALQETSAKLNPSGSVLMAMYGATIGKLGILSIQATTNQACCACSDFKGIINTYLFYFLLANRLNFIQMGGGGAQPNISKEKIVSTILPIPPYTEQRRIVGKIENMYNLLNIIEESLL